MDGYYQLEPVVIGALRQGWKGQSDIFNALYESLGPHSALAAYQIAHPRIQPFSGEPPGDEDCEYTAEEALDALTYELKGGFEIGHLAEYVPSAKAAVLATHFFAVFHEPRAFWGLG